jgi:hypothetical protein
VLKGRVRFQKGLVIGNSEEELTGIAGFVAGRGGSDRGYVDSQQSCSIRLIIKAGKIKIKEA